MMLVNTPQSQRSEPRQQDDSKIFKKDKVDDNLYSLHIASYGCTHSPSIVKLAISIARSQSLALVICAKSRLKSEQKNRLVSTRSS